MCHGVIQKITLAVFSETRCRLCTLHNVKLLQNWCNVHGVGVSGLLVAPEPVTVFVGENAKMLCRSDDVEGVNWEVRRISSTKNERICCNNGNILDEYTGKFSIESDPGLYPPIYNVIIHNASVSDAGEYTCFERSEPGNSASANLTVQERGKDGIAVYIFTGCFIKQTIRLIFLLYLCQVARGSTFTRLLLM